MQITICFHTNDKETELKRLQNPNLEVKFEVKGKFQGFNPHPVFHVAKIEHKTTPAPFEVVHIDFERYPNLPFSFFNIWQNRNLQPLFRT